MCILNANKCELCHSILILIYIVRHFQPRDLAAIWPDGPFFTFFSGDFMVLMVRGPSLHKAVLFRNRNISLLVNHTNFTAPSSEPHTGGGVGVCTDNGSWWLTGDLVEPIEKKIQLLYMQGHSMCYLLFLFFGGTGVWTQELTLVRQVLLYQPSVSLLISKKLIVAEIILILMWPLMTVENPLKHLLLSCLFSVSLYD
jgi:hypothetical protein